MAAENYTDFLKRKKHSTGDFGFDPVWMPESAFDFQEFGITKAVRKGRMGLFEDTGLGKTLQQLAIAENIIRHTNKRVLILTPLAVACLIVTVSLVSANEVQGSLLEAA